jgi:hypothetical protein
LLFLLHKKNQDKLYFQGSEIIWELWLPGLRETIWTWYFFCAVGPLKFTIGNGVNFDNLYFHGKLSVLSMFSNSSTEEPAKWKLSHFVQQYRTIKMTKNTQIVKSHLNCNFGKGFCSCKISILIIGKTMIVTFKYFPKTLENTKY